MPLTADALTWRGFKATGAGSFDSATAGAGIGGNGLPGGNGGGGQGCGCTGPAGSGYNDVAFGDGFAATRAAGEAEGLGDGRTAVGEGLGEASATTGRDPSPPVVTATATPATTTAAMSAAVSTRDFRGMTPSVRHNLANRGVKRQRTPDVRLRDRNWTLSTGGQVLGRVSLRRRVIVAVAAVAVGALTLTPGHASVQAPKQPFANGTAWRIWPLGDSITMGAGIPFTPGGYRDALDRQLTNARVGHKFIGTWKFNTSPELAAEGQGLHDGHGGYRIEDVFRDLTGRAGAKSDNGGYWLTGTTHRPAMYPDVVVIHLGTNDIVKRNDPGVRYPTATGEVDFRDVNQRHEFIGHVAGRLTALVDRIIALRPQTHIVLSAVAPITKQGFGVASEDYARWVKAVVAQEQSRGHAVVLADVYDAFFRSVGGRREVVPGLLDVTGIHPTPLGYQVMANIYGNSVRAALGL